MEDIYFIKDDLSYEREESLKALIKLLEEKPVPNEVFVAKRFMVSVMYAVKSLREKKERNIRYQKEMQLRQQPVRVIKKKPLAEELFTTEEIALNSEPDIVEQKINSEEIQLPPEIIEEHNAQEEQSEEISSKQEYSVILSSNQALAKVMINLDNDKMTYTVIEPKIDERVLNKTIDLLGRKLKKEPTIVKDDKILTKYISKACKKYNVEFNNIYFENIKYYLYRNYLHFGKIDPPLKDKNISSIICEGVSRPIIVMHNNQGMKTNITFDSNEEINELLLRFAKISGKVLDEKNNILDVVISNIKIEATIGFEEISSRFIIKKQ